MNELIDDLTAGPRVNFVYVSADGTDDCQFQARCHFLPCIGDHLTIPPGDKRVVVKDVYHKYVKVSIVDAIFVPNVVLSDPPGSPAV